MEAMTLIRRLHQHRAWVNQNLLAAASRLTEDQLSRSFQIGQGSIWKSLTHLYAAEYVWLAALHGDPDPLTPGDVAEKLPGNQEGPAAVQTLSELRSRWAELDQRWNEYLLHLSDDDLQQNVGKISSLSGQRHETVRVDILLHVCTHAQYTAAQAINMMRQAGTDELPDSMLITLARREAGGTPS